MTTTTTSAFGQTTAQAVAYAVSPMVVTHAFTMWTSPVAPNANKRSPRRPSGVMD